jgi:hypothetical protein
MQTEIGIRCQAMLVATTMLWPVVTLGAPQVPPSAPVTVVNTTANPVPVTGNVSGSVTITGTPTVQVTGTVETQTAIPSAAFSNSKGGVVSGPDPAGTSYAITSVTVANGGTEPILLPSVVAAYGPTGDCVQFTGPFLTSEGPGIVIPAEGSVHLSFPQPFVLAARPGAVSCLRTSTGSLIFVSVVGYRF